MLFPLFDEMPPHGDCFSANDAVTRLYSNIHVVTVVLDLSSEVMSLSHWIFSSNITLWSSRVKTAIAIQLTHKLLVHPMIQVYNCKHGYQATRIMIK